MSRVNEWGETPESQIKAVSKYNAKCTKLFSLRLNLKTDEDILQWLRAQTVPGKTQAGSIKRLIREEIRREQEARGSGA